MPVDLVGVVVIVYASEGGAAKVQDPLQSSEANMGAGGRAYVENCAVCHGLPGQSKTGIAGGEFPPPPQLFQPKEMVTDDPEGVTQWKISHGIRLSGMPGFANTLSDTEQWQLAMLLAHADKLPPTVSAELAKGGCETAAQGAEARSR